MANKKKLTILVTGGLGAIGIPLVRRLKEKEHAVWTIDLPHSEETNYMRCDVANFRELERIFEKINVDFVYHLAAEYGRVNGEEYYDRVWHTNVIGTKNILRLQEKQRFRMVFTSSSEIYGEWEDVMEEDVPSKYPIKQLNEYAISKWVNEMQILNSQERFNTKTVRVRLFNTYGPEERYSPYRSYICQFIYCALFDLPYTVYLDHHRTPSYIDDTIASLIHIIENFHAGAVYNIAGSEYQDIKTVSNMILQYLEKDDKLITYIPLEIHNTKDKKASIERAVKDLKHNPLVSLSEGIPKTIEWQRKFYGKNSKGKKEF